MINYKINKEYMNWLASKLESADLNRTDSKFEDQISGYRIPSLVDQMGITAKHYLDNKKKTNDSGNLSDDSSNLMNPRN